MDLLSMAEGFMASHFSRRGGNINCPPHTPTHFSFVCWVELYIDMSIKLLNTKPYPVLLPVRMSNAPLYFWLPARRKDQNCIFSSPPLGSTSFCSTEEAFWSTLCCFESFRYLYCPLHTHTHTHAHTHTVFWRAYAYVLLKNNVFADSTHSIAWKNG